jgi:probable phosphoglycerate mutase
MVAVLDELDPVVPTVLVSHGDAIRAAVAHLLGHSMAHAPWVEVPNGSVARYDGDLDWLEHRERATS